jgi:hypothetical protein
VAAQPPIAVQSAVLGHDTPGRTLSAAPDGCPGVDRVQAEPFHISARLLVVLCVVAPPTAMHRLTDGQDMPPKPVETALGGFGVLCCAQLVPS